MYPIELSLANEHVRDLHTAAAHARLVALVECSRPAAWRRAATLTSASFGGVVAWLRRGELGAPGTCATC